MNILNKFPVLADVTRIDSNTILLEFTNQRYFNITEPVHALTLSGQNISAKVSLIKEHHLNSETVVVDEGNGWLSFYSGNLHESPDWGDWNSSFDLGFETCQESITTKSQRLCNTELLNLLKEKVLSKAWEAVTNQEFRTQAANYINGQIDRRADNKDVRENLAALLSKIENLDDRAFYLIFMENYKMPEW